MREVLAVWYGRLAVVAADDARGTLLWVLRHILVQHVLLTSLAARHVIFACCMVLAQVAVIDAHRADPLAAAPGLHTLDVKLQNLALHKAIWLLETPRTDRRAALRALLLALACLLQTAAAVQMAAFLVRRCERHTRADGTLEALACRLVDERDVLVAAECGQRRFSRQARISENGGSRDSGCSRESCLCHRLHILDRRLRMSSSTCRARARICCRADAAAMRVGERASRATQRKKGTCESLACCSGGPPVGWNGERVAIPLQLSTGSSTSRFASALLVLVHHPLAAVALVQSKPRLAESADSRLSYAESSHSAPQQLCIADDSMGSRYCTRSSDTRTLHCSSSSTLASALRHALVWHSRAAAYSSGLIIAGVVARVADFPFLPALPALAAASSTLLLLCIYMRQETRARHTVTPLTSSRTPPSLLFNSFIASQTKQHCALLALFLLVLLMSIQRRRWQCSYLTAMTACAQLACAQTRMLIYGALLRS